MTITPTPQDQASTADKAHPDSLALWWVGTEDSAWCEGFKHWAETASSLRPSEQTWRIHFVHPETLTLPRTAYRASTDRAGGLGIIAWLIPSEGIADTVRRIATVQRTRPHYLHLTAGLASPAEQRLLSEVGVRAHVQQPNDWNRQNALISRWLG